MSKPYFDRRGVLRGGPSPDLHAKEEASALEAIRLGQTFLARHVKALARILASPAYDADTRHAAWAALELHAKQLRRG